MMKLNTCSKWEGAIKAINHGSIVSEVTLEISPEIRVTAIVSKSAVENLGLKVGSTFYALINSTEVPQFAID